MLYSSHLRRQPTDISMLQIYIPFSIFASPNHHSGLFFHLPTANTIYRARPTTLSQPTTAPLSPHFCRPKHPDAPKTQPTDTQHIPRTISDSAPNIVGLDTEGIRTRHAPDTDQTATHTDTSRIQSAFWNRPSIASTHRPPVPYVAMTWQPPKDCLRPLFPHNRLHNAVCPTPHTPWAADNGRPPHPYHSYLSH